MVDKSIKKRKSIVYLSWFQQKHIILGVSGGIACYKACELARELGRRGAEVRVVMTESATAFVSPLTFQALTGKNVHISLLDPASEAGMGHIELARWADLIIIAPCTANTMARLANGEAPDLLTTLWIAASCEKVVAPAMNQQMWLDRSTQTNLETLSHRSVHVTGPDSGMQACGDLGLGRMMEPLNILDHLEHALNQGPLAGQKIVITAGPTHEPLDPVRFLANRSSGKMGFALAAAAVKLGGSVTLISGPVHLETPKGVTRVNVETAKDMLKAVTYTMGQTDIFIGSAAVCDLRPETKVKRKLKKSQDDLFIIRLKENPDIIKYISNHETRPSIVVGFAAETEFVIEHAKQKLISKSLDLVVANSVANGEIFGENDTTVTMIDQQSIEVRLSGTKIDVALHILNRVVELLINRIEYEPKI